MPAATMQNRKRKQPIRQETPKGSEAPDPPVLAMTERFGHDERAVLPSMEGKAPCARREERSRTASAYEQVDDHEHPYEHTAPSDSPGRRGAFPLAANGRPRPPGATPRCPFPSMRLFYRFVGRASSSIALYAPAAYENVPSSGSHVMPKRRA